jgi:hypothetical protein
MKPFDRLSDYLSALERRLRWVAITRGAAVTAAAALALTVIAVVVANRFAFSNPSIAGARIFLFLGLAFAIAAALIVPVIRLNRRRAARQAESKYPQFQERLLTFTERIEQTPSDPFLHLLAADTLTVAQDAQPEQVAKSGTIFGFFGAAVASAAILLWLATSGPGFLGYGTGLLWGGIPKGVMKPYYAISVSPGNKTIRRRSDQVISAQLMGFSAPKVEFFAKYASASQWQGAEMRTEPGGSAYQFLIAGVPEPLEYYVEAGGVRSQTYKLNVIDLPSVKKIAVTYHFPAWSGMKDATEDPGGDLRAVEGTTAELFVHTDRPLASGAILLDDGSKVKLESGPNGTLTAKVPINKDGMYHVAALENGEDVRLTEDYFIEAMKDNPPDVRITRPGRDFRASPIEEVTVAVEAKDDFGLKDVALHYSVNGAPEKSVPLLKEKGSKESNGTALLSLEDFKVQPGDVVAVYATANDARSTAKTDMFFIQAEPFERNYSQSQQAGGGGAGGDGQQQNEISERQKEIITATWNQLKGQGAKGTDAENAAFLAGVQSKLRDQAQSLAQRMKSRELDEAGDSFKKFVADMEQAVAAMGPAAEKLKGAHWQDALAPEQKALQFLLRAEDRFRDIQVAFGQQGGGGGGGMNGATRDLQGLFDLELDTEKNQYESAQASQSAGAQQRQIDEALQKLQQLARRQQELAEQQRQGQNTSQQRWEQEMLRREAEQLRQQIDQLNRQQRQQLSRNGQQGQQSQQGQQGQQQSGQQGQMSDQRLQQLAQGGQQQNPQQQQSQDPRLRGASPQQLQQTLDRLNQALQQMRDAQSQSPQSQADARRAADALREATQSLKGLQSQQSASQMDDIARKANELAQRQQQFEGDLRRAYTQSQGNMTRQQAADLANRHEGEVDDLKNLEQQMQNAVRDMAAGQRQTSSKLRQALSDMQQAEIARDMQRNAEWIRRGMGEYAAMSEAQITAGLNQLRDEVNQIRQQMGQGGQQAKDAQGDKAVENALSQVEQLRQQVEARARQLAQNGQGQQQQGQGQQRQGQQLSRNGQQGQQQNGQQGQQGQQAGQQQGQQGPGGQQRGGNADGQRGGTYADYGGAWNGGSPDYGYRNGAVRDQDIQLAYRNAMQSLQQLQQQYRNDPNASRDINNMIRDFRQSDPFHYSNEGLLSDRIQAALANIEQVEMELRRKVGQDVGDGSIRSPGSEPVPQGYSDAVAEYFRKLSKSKQ